MPEPDDNTEANRLRRIDILEAINRRAKHDPQFAIAWAILELVDVLTDALADLTPPGSGR